MPGVAVLPSSPGLGGFGSPQPGSSEFWVSLWSVFGSGTPAGRPSDNMTVSEIKSKAKETVQKQGKGVSPMSLLKAARNQSLNAKDHEAKGDLKSALSSFIKTASLMKMALDSNEHNLMDHLQGDCGDLTARTKAVEEKLRAIEKRAAEAAQNEGPVFKAGGSIADRVKALQDHGLSVGSNKRASLPGPPAPQQPNLPTPPIASSVAPPSVSPSPHTLVSPSSFGPPSPSSSPSSSPQIDIANFAQSFPSIDELDEHPAFQLPSAPTTVPGEILKPTPKPQDIGGPSALTSFRNYAIQIERPSSTPIPNVSNGFTSRPSSPATRRPSAPKVPLPNTNAARPKDLANYIRDYKVLVIDVRDRAEFDKEHIRASAIICVEPTVLKRPGINTEVLETAMVVGPRGEASLFENRDKFDLVAVYDQSSASFGDSDSPLSVLVRIISEQAFKKMLKRMPMMLVGGLDAWKNELGPPELAKGTPVMNGSVALPAENGAQQIWTPKPKADGDGSGHSRAPADHSSSIPNGTNLARRSAMVRPSSGSISHSRSQGLPSSPLASPQPNGSISGPITYPSFPRRISPTASGSSQPQQPLPSTSQPHHNGPSLSAQPSSSSDYIDQSQQALSALQQGVRSPIDYPELSMSNGQILRPPPIAASPALDRQDNRPRLQPGYTPPNSGTGVPGAGLNPPDPPKIKSDYPVKYWDDGNIGMSGLKNLGNTCYMNAPIQCLSATVPFARFFTDGRWKTAINYTNKMGTQGQLVHAFAKLVYEMWRGDLPYLTPIDFKKSICQLSHQYIGSDQHDSQEFLSFLLDGMHEDLNRVMVQREIKVTPEQEAELERLPPMIASDREWRAWRARNDSLIVDYFQGQFRSRLQCLTCQKTSTTYNVFSILQLPIPHSRNSKVPIQKCLDALFNEEVLEKDDAWDCPRCKTKRRALKTLSLARLPPILLIHLKRFEANGRFSDKIDTFVEFPVKGLDLTNYMPPPLPPGADKSEIMPLPLDDPRVQLPPYKYDLYGVTNHYGNLSSGHYTAYIASRGGWMLCDDSSIKQTDPKQVVNQKAYVLFYKRVRNP
ncbi:ubiquitin carboxyl-terminal hydrolase 4 [Coprinopsis sp. MPI-PUGE-AT-0042]|nr:ubiquitin carboxyl-terminal hydrolase 4 [Coprinopsis sp. MPI-PUGE-AT-0042]